MKTNEQIKKLVDEGGWDKVRAHPEFGPMWKRIQDESKKYVNAVVDSDCDILKRMRG